MKRPTGPAGQEGQNNAKAPKVEGAMADNPDREHALLVKVLAPSVPPANKLSLATIEQYLDDETGRILNSTPGGRGLEEALQFVARGWRKSEEGGVIPSTWPGIPKLQEAGQTVCLTLLVAAPTEDKVRALSALLNTPVPLRLMTELLTAAAEDDEVPPKLLTELAAPLRERRLNDQRQPELQKLMRTLRASKKYCTALVAPPCLEELWRPTFEPKFVWTRTTGTGANKKREVVGKQRSGNVLQTKTLLGWALSPTALDSGCVGPSKAHLTEAGSHEWSDLHRATRQRIEGLQRGTQMKVANVHQNAAELIDVMLRAGDAPRMAVLEWLGTVIESAQPRGRQGYVAPEGFNFWPQNGHHIIDVLGHNETPPFERSLKNLLMLQALHARIQGFPTSGCALNVFNVMLHLLKPIKGEQANTISAFYPLRKDVKELMGAWDRETRFGEKEEVEKATEFAAGDPGFTAAPGDKSLFKTQVFWLASKSVGSLLLPVVKEAFHAMQGIASVFVEKDRSTSDVAWREYLLAESILKEPEFLAKLGHLVDLTFRFLMHAAAEGKQALPPPAPGPTWHATPTTMLENVIDLCDLYRDRQRKTGGMPTGLYVHLDPEPVLTALCVVMASDEHVRDPSLRGKAVKLMHRLCLSFPAWQEKLNHPPFTTHLIPCLVNVFIAVEKAVMSYYDLSYRYKYELRIPVMELFDLALQHEEHRKVLAEFSKGVGNDRFIKLLTQLINDSNSQITEAITTVKEFHQNKGQQAEPAAHDEQVLDDDAGAQGEDVYRRSRMNYKEHAKKYFSLAAKTWKQLWLLCKHCSDVIVEGRTLLEQLVHSSLDAQLHFLVGPEMKIIKADPREYEELGFNGKEMVRQIAEIYLFLRRINHDEVARIVAKDERYYDAKTFGKAVNFVRKYGLLMGPDLSEFEKFVGDLAHRVSAQRAAFDEADIPPEYLCEMMADIMSDPVQFPQSKKIVDRSTAVRQILSSDRDPYANTPLKVEELVPCPELKEQIHRFAKDKGIALEGGNMFG